MDPAETHHERPGRAGVEAGVPTTLAMAASAVAAALITIFGDKQGAGAATMACALVGLLPWALLAGGVRIHPLVFAVTTITPVAIATMVDRNPGAIFPAMVAVVWITRETGRSWATALTVVASLASIVALAVTVGTTHETGSVYFAGGIGISLLTGSMLRRQETLVARLREARTREGEHAVAAERTRIAREVHDVVAHSMTVMMLHVTGARRVIGSDPARAEAALANAERVGRASLDSIRNVVGLLRTEADVSDEHTPLPTLDDLPQLLAEFRDSGLVVAADVELDGLDLDPTTQLVAYRTIQESLSNVVQHAPGAPVELRVAADGRGTVLRIVAENPIPTPSPLPPRRSRRVGLGLRGMDERVRAAGGSVETGRTDEGRWRVDAALPVTRLGELR